jgi:hypothetical protein
MAATDLDAGAEQIWCRSLEALSSGSPFRIASYHRRAAVVLLRRARTQTMTQS